MKDLAGGFALICFFFACVLAAAAGDDWIDCRKDGGSALGCAAYALRLQ